MIIQHNLEAMNSNRMLGLTKSRISKSSEKLSSGYRVNRAADDAAGLAISEKMRRQIRGLTQASENCQDGVSLCQIADGALNEVHDMLKRCEELAVQAANDTNTEEDRDYIQMELNALEKEIDRVHETTVFNNQNIFSDYGQVPAFVKAGNQVAADVIIDSEGTYRISTSTGQTITLAIVDKDGNKVTSPVETGAVGNDNPDEIQNSSLAQFTQKAAANAVSRIASKYPQLFAAASTKNIQVGLQLMNIDGTSNTLATASVANSSSESGAIMSYSMSIDISDYPIEEFDDFTDVQKADLAAVIAHEMTHLITYDTIYNNSWNDGREDSFLDNSMFDPTTHWFVEGIAQTSSGDNGWFYLDEDSSDAEIIDYMSELKEEYPGGLGTYGAGYAATMWLGMLASGEDPADSSKVTSANIAAGLDKIMTYMATHKQPDNGLDDAIMALTDFGDGYELRPGEYGAGIHDFMDAFKSGSDGSLQFMKNLIAARGDNGAGSILYDLAASETAAFNPSGLTGTYNSYNINADNRWYANSFGDYTIPDDYFIPDSKSRPGGSGAGGYGFKIQAGAESGQYIHIDQFNISAQSLLGGQKMDVTGKYEKPEASESDAVLSNNDRIITLRDTEARANTIDIIKQADRRVSLIRSYYGATQNRLEHTIKNLNNIVENTTAAESQIRDTDIATEMVAFSNNNILAQAGQSILAQTNQSKQGILSLLS